MTGKLVKTDTSRTTILIRLMVGSVFLSEGIQKFLYPAMRGPGRFEGMGFPAPEFFGNFVGVFEILAGLLILTGFFTRLGGINYIYNDNGCYYCYEDSHRFWSQLWTVCPARTQHLRLLEYGPTKCVPTGRCGWVVSDDQGQR